MNRPIWPLDGTLTGTITLDQSVSMSSGNEGIVHIPQPPRLKSHNPI